MITHQTTHLSLHTQLSTIPLCFAQKCSGGGGDGWIGNNVLAQGKICEKLVKAKDDRGRWILQTPNWVKPTEDQQI